MFYANIIIRVCQEKSTHITNESIVTYFYQDGKPYYRLQRVHAGSNNLGALGCDELSKISYTENNV